jgi:predicted nucleic acid-binding protein
VIVLDASVVLELLLGTPTGEQVERRIRREGLHAPHLLSVEVINVLRRFVAARDVLPAVAEAALRDLADLPIRRWSHEPLLNDVWARRANLTAYDAVYVALAERLQAPLLTTDARLRRGAPTSARIEVVRTVR